MHTNIVPKVARNEGTVDSYLYDYDFQGVIHQCPYDSVDELHDVEAIVKAVDA